MKQMFSSVKKGMFFLFMWSFSLCLLAQNITVRGTVTDTSGEPLIGVTVQVKGTSVGTVTDIDGTFILSNVPSNATLEISYVSMASQSVAVNGRTTLNIVLQEDAETLDEVVVVGYGVQKKETLTGAIAQVRGEELENRITSNMTSALQGVLANVNVSINNQGGEPGSVPSINIRGYGSLSGSNPLVIIDGVESKLENINPNDVESIAVMKDATATAIFGSRAAFGVLNIKTKRGRDTAGKISVRLNSTFGMNGPVNLPQPASGYEWLYTLDTAFHNAGLTSPITSETLQKARENHENPGTHPAITVNPTNPDRFTSYYDAVGNTNWYQVYYKPWALTQKHDINVSGGSQKANYFISGGFYNEDGIYRIGDEKFQRYNFVANIDSKISNWLSLQFNNRYTRRDIDTPHNYSDIGDFHHSIARTWSNMPEKDPNGNYYESYHLLLSQAGRNKRNQNELLNSVNVILEPLKGWKINFETNIRQNFNNQTNHKKTVYSTLADGITKSRSGVSFPNFYLENCSRDFYNTNNLYSNFDLNIAKHKITFMGGMQNEYYYHTSVEGRNNDLVTESVPSLKTATGQIYLSGNKGHWSTLSYFGRINYNFNDKFLFEVLGRYNGSSRFAPGYNWGFFPAFSAGYVISNNDFWEDNLASKVSFLKIRGSMGEVGNQDVANYLYLPTMGITKNLNWIINGARPIYVRAAGLISPDVTWETVRTANIGFDSYFLNNRLSLIYDYFVRETKNMFGPAESLPATLGASAPKRNNADLQTKGFEMQIAWRDKIGDLGYNMAFNLSDNQTTITRYKNDNGVLSDYYVGRKIGEIWGYNTVGIYQSQEEADAGPDQTYFFSRWGEGDIEYADLNKDGKINPGNNTLDDHGDLSIIGNSTPHFSYGINLGLDWKNFDLSVFCQGVGKRDAAPSGNMFYGITGDVWQSSVFVQHLDYWSSENPNAYYPKPYLGTNEHSKNIQTQTRFLQNAAYFRLKSFQFGYTLPVEKKIKFPIEKIRFFITGENLFTLTKMNKTFDPETAFVGAYGSGKAYPLRRTFSFGLNVDL